MEQGTSFDCLEEEIRIINSPPDQNATTPDDAKRKRKLVRALVCPFKQTHIGLF